MDEKKEDVYHVDAVKREDDGHVQTMEEEAVDNAKHINLSWRSWVVVFFCCFAYVPRVQS